VIFIKNINLRVEKATRETKKDAPFFGRQNGASFGVDW